MKKRRCITTLNHEMRKNETEEHAYNNLSSHIYLHDTYSNLDYPQGANRVRHNKTKEVGDPQERIPAKPDKRPLQLLQRKIGEFVMTLRRPRAAQKTDRRSLIEIIKDPWITIEFPQGRDVLLEKDFEEVLKRRRQEYKDTHTE